MKSVWAWLAFGLLALAVAWSQHDEGVDDCPGEALLALSRGHRAEASRRIEQCEAAQNATAAEFSIALNRGRVERASDAIARANVALDQGWAPEDGWRPTWRASVATHILAQRFEAAARQLDAVVARKDPRRSAVTTEALQCLAAAAHTVAGEEGIQTLHEHRAHEVCGTLYIAMSAEHVAFNRPQVDHFVPAETERMHNLAGGLVVAEVSPWRFLRFPDEVQPWERVEGPISPALGLMHAALAPTSRATEAQRRAIRAKLDQQYARLGVGIEVQLRGTLDPTARLHADRHVRGSSSVAPLETIARLRQVAIEANDAAWLAELDEDRDRWIAAISDREVSLLLSALDTVY